MKQLFIITILFLCGILANAQLIDGAEYFWDDDPGVGNGTFIGFNANNPIDENLAISPAGLKQGPHLLGVRTHHNDGSWSVTSVRRIVVNQYTSAEFFWDNDPGVGLANPAALNSIDDFLNTEIEINSLGVSGGRHTLGVRTEGIGGVWSITKYETVYVPTLYTEGEYFWDTDPGVGNANSFNLSETSDTLNESVSINNNGVTRGWHNLYTRVRGKFGSFGPTKKQRIFISRNIVGGEYFWDTDPGVGNGNPITTISIGSTAQVCDDVPTIGLTEGEHYLYVRTVGDDGVWSIPLRLQFTVTPNENIVGCQGDFNRDGLINAADLITMLAAFGTFGECSADLTGDFVVNTNDLVFFLSLYGTICE